MNHIWIFLTQTDEMLQLLHLARGKFWVHGATKKTTCPTTLRTTLAPDPGTTICHAGFERMSSFENKLHRPFA